MEVSAVEFKGILDTFTRTEGLCKMPLYFNGAGDYIIAEFHMGATVGDQEYVFVVTHVLDTDPISDANSFRVQVIGTEVLRDLAAASVWDGVEKLELFLEDDLLTVQIGDTDVEVEIKPRRRSPVPAPGGLRVLNEALAVRYDDTHLGWHSPRSIGFGVVVELLEPGSVEEYVRVRKKIDGKTFDADAVLALGLDTYNTEDTGSSSTAGDTVTKPGSARRAAANTNTEPETPPATAPAAPPATAPAAPPATAPAAPPATAPAAPPATAPADNSTTEDDSAETPPAPAAATRTKKRRTAEELRQDKIIGAIEILQDEVDAEDVSEQIDTFCIGFLQTHGFEVVVGCSSEDEGELSLQDLASCAQHNLLKASEALGRIVTSSEGLLTIDEAIAKLRG